MSYEKVEKIIKVSKKYPVVKRLWSKVKNNEISLDTGHKGAVRVEEVTRLFNKSDVDSFKEAGIKAQEKKGIMNLAKNTIPQMYICKRCPKATLTTIQYRGGETVSIVVCDDDVVNGLNKFDIIKILKHLRNPDSKFCKKSPHYDLLVKKVLTT